MDGAGLLFVAIAFMNVCSFVFHVAASRLLQPQAYGALGALVAMMFFLVVPANALQAAIVASVARRHPPGDTAPISLRHLTLVTGGIGLGVFCLGALLSPIINDFLHLHSLIAVVLLSLLLLPSLVSIVVRSVLIGQGYFRPAAVSIAIAAATRVITTLLLIQIGMGVAGAVAGTVVSEVLGLLVLARHVRAGWIRDNNAPAVTVSHRDVAAGMVAFTGFWLFIGLDAFLARHFLSAQASGFYAAASTAGRAALFLPQAVSLIALPRFAETHRERPQALTVLNHSLTIVAILGALTTLGLTICSHIVIRLLFGSAYSASGTIVGELAGASALMGAANVLMHFHLAQRSWQAHTCAVSAICMAAAITLQHDSIAAIAHIVVVGSMATVTVLLATAYVVPGQRRTRQSMDAAQITPEIIHP
jgi:O-antigen/teichoic acid export membrane protein